MNQTYLHLTQQVIYFLLLCCSFLWSATTNAQCTITLQPDGIQGKDAEVNSLSCSSSYAVSTNWCETVNGGTTSNLRSKAWTWWGTHAAIRSLLEFDLSSLPAGCTVTNATLIMHNGNDNPNAYHCGQNSTIHPCLPNDIYLHRITQSWQEHTVNWLNQPTYASTNLGTDYIFEGNNSQPYNDYSFDITDMVNFWLANPAQNHGMLLKQQDETNHYKSVWFRSSDHSNPAVRPELVLTLNCSGNCDNIIEGNIFDDLNGDCVMGTNDLPLENWVVEILPGPIYTSTDVNGFYRANVLDGTYTVNVFNPNTNLWYAGCPANNTQSVTVSGGSTGIADFAYDAAYYCPLLTVDVASNFLRKCHTENFIVHYCNHGNVVANNAYVEVNFSNGLTPLSSDATYTVNSSSQWSFPVGNLAPGACGSFYVLTQISCDANFGDIECVTAEIYPDYPCSELPGDSTVWDRSSVMVVGTCQGDTAACFTITNTGSASNGNMQGTSTYRIYDNNVLVHTGTFQLAGGASTVICWPTTGNTIRLEADQRPGHPGNSHPNAVVDNCGNNSAAFNLGLTLPENDAPADIAVECAEVRSSYDPNDKRVIPAGVGAQHYVDQNIMLDYKIRFQNTGNDTALNIVIKDTLSPYLDLSSIQIGASSHSYSFSIENGRALKFSFNNIMLPDSNVNEPLSHGFVKFKIKQLPNLPIGTVINNSASIYFDYNAPVLTNNTFLTIGDMNHILTVNTEEIEKETININIYPNPFGRSAVVYVQGYEGKEPINFELFNALGVRVQVVQTLDHNFEIKRSNLPSGVYLYRATANQSLLGSGKLIIE
ncbi:DNRLRE domain-containing protein [Aureispira sp. CCB-E]|uniref:DUF7619 domain-containing protein n=1 Tax=Aureispira sp. CCB-E TaxID=3051121 RepID=UPI002868D209|nr:DNRLRE domain-containing protein [Aureispira sp. CCB-E]WMX15991.1 DNRLRE domain-containing protein [Aureispira sp. CCB-E]